MKRLLALFGSFYLIAILTASADPPSHQIDVLIVTTVKGVPFYQNDIDGVKSIFTQAEDCLTVTPDNPDYVATDAETKAEDLLPEITFHSHKPMIKPSDEKTLIDYLSKGRVNPSDGVSSTVFCYLKLHGFCDNTGEHYMQLDDGSLISRTTVMSALRVREADLTILVTDSCSATSHQLPKHSTAAVKYPKDLFLDLFVRARAIVDINSSDCKPDQGIYEYAWMVNDGEGLFSQVFISALTEDDPRKLQAKLERIDAPKPSEATTPQTGNGRYSWQEFHNFMSQKTEAEYQSLRAEYLRKYQAYLDNSERLPPDDLDVCMDVIRQPHQTLRAFTELPTEP